MADLISPLWATKYCSYPPRPGNEIKILIDGQAAYQEIAAAFKRAKKFIYLTISFGAQDFLLVPASNDGLFDLLRSCAKDQVDVRMVVWQPADPTTPDTIPDPAPKKIPGVNEGPGSIQARWDKAKGYIGWYSSRHGHFEPFPLIFRAKWGCHHQKTYVMDDGEGGVAAFVGGINPVQSYWDTPDHDSLDARRVDMKKYPNPLNGLEETPPLHDIFYRIKGPAAGDVLANFVERYNGARIRHGKSPSKIVAPVTANQIPPRPNGIEVQVLRTIAPGTYRHRFLVLVRQLLLWLLGSLVPKAYRETRHGDRGIRELYLNVLERAAEAGEGTLVYIENQYFFDHGIISAIHEAAEKGVKIIALLTSKPDEGTFLGRVEKEWERISSLKEQFKLVEGHKNVALLTLGNCRPDPRSPGKFINSETYIHSKTMALFTPDWAVMTGGSANIAFTSMWFHSEMNIAFMDPALIKDWVAQLWKEHLRIPIEEALGLIGKPDDALNFFKAQANRNLQALNQGLSPEGRVYDWQSTDFPPRDLTGIDLDKVIIGEECSQG